MLSSPNPASHEGLSARLARHVRPGPRYTSYPPATEFVSGFGPDAARAHLAARGDNAPVTPVSLYCHIPFCSRLCWYCACNVTVTRNRDRSRAYIDTLRAEFALVAAAMGAPPPIAEVAFGGGSPNFLPPQQLAYLMEAIDEHFALQPDAEFGVELDPRDTTREHLATLASLGFTRLSVGVQDFADEVQKAINRHQSPEQTRELIHHARRLGFTSVNIDLVYGLPGQTPDSLAQTIATVLEFAPQQVALFGYAHLPDRFRHQRLVERHAPVPNLAQRADLFVMAQEAFEEAGYVRIGLDHFAQANSPLVRAALSGTLQRNFQGYCPRRADALIACGVSAISSTGSAYWQNHGEIDRWTQMIEAGQLPVARGVELDKDDQLRRDVITQLMCAGELDFADIDRRYDICFENYFRDELDCLEDDEYDELVDIDLDSRWLGATQLGNDLIRNICMVFDRYQRKDGAPARFSTTL